MFAAWYAATKQTNRLIQLDFLPLSRWLVSELLRDMDLFSMVPALKPLQPKILALCSKIAKLRSTRPSGYRDALRAGIDPIIDEFFRLITAEALTDLKAYLKARRKLDVENVVMSESPY